MVTRVAEHFLQIQPTPNFSQRAQTHGPKREDER